MSLPLARVVTMATKKPKKTAPQKAAKAATKKTGRPAKRKFVATVVISAAPDAKLNVKKFAYLVKQGGDALIHAISTHPERPFDADLSLVKATFLEDKTPPVKRDRSAASKGGKKAGKKKVSG